MATRRRNREPSVADSLLREGHRFEFFQAVRLLERNLKGEPSVGEQSVPGRERIKFRSRVRMDFPASDINKVIPPKGDDERHELDTNFLPVGGFNGPLPQPYVQTLLDRTKRRDYAMRDFIDIFHHRLISVFYRIRKKHRVALDQSHPGETHFTRYFLSFLGLGTKGTLNRLGVSTAADLNPVAGSANRSEEQTEGLRKLLNPWLSRTAPVDDRALIRFAGLLNQRPRSAVGLELFLRVRLPHWVKRSGIIPPASKLRSGRSILRRRRICCHPVPVMPAFVLWPGFILVTAPILIFAIVLLPARWIRSVWGPTPASAGHHG